MEKKKRKKKKKNCILEGEETSLLMLWAYTHTGIYSKYLSPYVHTLDISITIHNVAICFNPD